MLPSQVCSDLENRRAKRGTSSVAHLLIFTISFHLFRAGSFAHVSPCQSKSGIQILVAIDIHVKRTIADFLVSINAFVAPMTNDDDFQRLVLSSSGRSEDFILSTGSDIFATEAAMKVSQEDDQKLFGIAHERRY